MTATEPPRCKSDCVVRKLSSLLHVFIVIQVMASFAMTGHYVLLRSHLRFWAKGFYLGMSRLDALPRLLGREYALSLRLAYIPESAGILVASSDRRVPLLNYYLLPRRLYRYPGVMNEADVRKLSPALLRNIDYALLYQYPDLKIFRIEGPAPGR